MLILCPWPGQSRAEVTSPYALTAANPDHPSWPQQQPPLAPLRGHYSAVPPIR